MTNWCSLKTTTCVLEGEHAQMHQWTLVHKTPNEQKRHGRTSYFVLRYALKVARELVFVHVLQELYDPSLAIDEQKTVADKLNLLKGDRVDKRAIKDAGDGRGAKRHGKGK